MLGFCGKYIYQIWKYETKEVIKSNSGIKLSFQLYKVLVITDIKIRTIL